MAVQVPTLDRFAPQTAPSVGRVDVNVPNFAAATAPQAQAAGKLVETGAEVFIQQVKLEADTRAQEAANEFHNFSEDNLIKAKQQKGDPVPIYDSYRKSTQEKYDQLKLKYKDASTETQAAVQLGLDKTKQKFYDRVGEAEARQGEDYRTANTRAGVKLAQYDAMDSVAHFDVKDPNNTVGLNRSLGDIYDLNVKNGLANGSVREVKDKAGNVVGHEMDPTVKVQLAKDRSDALYQAINNLSKSGDIEGAKFLVDKYQGYLIKDEELKDKIEKDNLDVQAINIARDLQFKPQSQQDAELRKIKDPKLYDKVDAKLETYRKRNETQAKAVSNDNYKASANIILDRQKKGIPFQNIDDMYSDPTIKRIIDNVKDPKEILALQRMIKQPGESDPESKAEIQRMLFNGEFAGMDPSEFNQHLAGLNKSDRNKMENQFVKFNTQTPTQETQMTKNMGSQLTRELNRLGYVKKNDFGKYSNRDYNKITEANDGLIDSLDKVGPLTPQEQSKWVQKYAASIKSGETFDPSGVIQPKQFQGRAKPRTKEEVVVPNAPVTAEIKAAREKAAYEFKAKFKRYPNDLPELLKYMNDSKGR